MEGKVSMRLNPVPARSTLQIYTKGLQLKGLQQYQLYQLQEFY